MSGSICDNRTDGRQGVRRGNERGGEMRSGGDLGADARRGRLRMASGCLRVGRSGESTRLGGQAADTSAHRSPPLPAPASGGCRALGLSIVLGHSFQSRSQICSPPRSRPSSPPALPQFYKYTPPWQSVPHPASPQSGLRSPIRLPLLQHHSNTCSNGRLTTTPSKSR